METDESLIRQRQVNNVTLAIWGQPRPTKPGTLLFFPSEYIYRSGDDQLTQYLYKNIQGIQRTGERDILVATKTFQVFRITTSSLSDLQAVADTLLALALQADLPSLYAFFYRPDFARDNNPFADAEAWFLYDPVQQMARMKIPTSEWRITDVNADYKGCARAVARQFCPTYPSRFIVPNGLEDFFLEAVAQFRHRRRIPALAYYHAPTKAASPTQAAIMRSGQPLVGLNKRRCYEDEKLFAAMVRQGTKDAVPVIIDARTKAAASATQTRGVGGYEPVERYGQARVLFARLEPPPTLREYLDRLLDSVRHRDRTMAVWLTDSAPWLGQVQLCLLAAATIAQSILKGSCVLLHCEDDADTVAVLASLAKLCVDPFYRTRKGFQYLIEEDWVAFGFRFSDRCGHLIGEPVHNRRELQAPYFTLFVDCVFQMMDQYPAAFEFNMAYVFTIFEHTSSCKFGTFLLNSERERVAARLSERSVSLWTQLDQPDAIALHTNPYYQPQAAALPVASDTRAVTFMAALYAPWLVPSHQQNYVRNGTPDATLAELRQEWARLQEQIAQVVASSGAAAPAAAA